MVTKESFLSKVEKTESCWIWNGSRNSGNRGTLTYKSKVMLAHRMSYILFKGEIPEGLLICHHCDNPPCVNPEHLFAGTHKDNMQDASKKGRLGKGSANFHNRKKEVDDRIRQVDLEILCGVLNKITGSHMEQFTSIDGKLKANVGNFHLSWAYGGVCLHRMHSIGGSVTCPLGQDHVGKKELYAKMQAFIRGLEYQKNGT